MGKERAWYGKLWQDDEVRLNGGGVVLSTGAPSGTEWDEGHPAVIRRCFVFSGCSERGCCPSVQYRTPASYARGSVLEAAARAQWLTQIEGLSACRTWQL